LQAIRVVVFLLMGAHDKREKVSEVPRWQAD